MNKKAIFIAVAIFFVISGYLLYNKFLIEADKPFGEFSAEDCARAGGEVVNILDDERANDLEFRRDHKTEFCNNSSIYLGEVTGLHCPCICCKK